MGTKRIGLARIEALIENLKRDLDFSGSQIKLDGTSDNVNRMAGKTPERYYLEEFFKQKPGINGDLAATAEATNSIANKDFELLGTSAVSTCSDFSTTLPGISLTTTTTEADQCIVAPHLDTDQSAWSVCKWPTHASIEWECSLTLAALDNQAVWAGLKLTNDHIAVTDADQIYFVCRSDAASGLAEELATTDSAAMAVAGTNMQWHCIYSIAGVDYTTNLGLAVAAGTTYHFKIVIDSDRKAAVYVNGTLYGLVNDSGHTGGNAGTTATWGQTDTLINGASGGSTSTTAIQLTVDGVDVRTTFKKGDVVHVTGTSVPIGVVQTVDSATLITLKTLDATIANNVELFNFGQKATGSTQKSKALTDVDFIPYVGIECGAGAAEILRLHYIAMNRTIAD